MQRTAYVTTEKEQLYNRTCHVCSPEAPQCATEIPTVDPINCETVEETPCPWVRTLTGGEYCVHNGEHGMFGSYFEAFRSSLNERLSLNNGMFVALGLCDLQSQMDVCRTGICSVLTKCLWYKKQTSSRSVVLDWNTAKVTWIPFRTS
jgi:hypothetical protein